MMYVSLCDIHTNTQPEKNLSAILLVQRGYTDVMLNNQMAYIFVKQRTLMCL